MIKSLKYLKIALLLVFLVKVTLPFYGALHAEMKSENFSALSKILGEEVIICTSANDSGFYLISLSQIDKDSQNNKHHSNCFECPYCSSKTADSKIFNNDFADEVYYLNASVNISSNYNPFHDYILKYKHSQAPPYFS